MAPPVHEVCIQNKERPIETSRGCLLGYEVAHFLLSFSAGPHQKQSESRDHAVTESLLCSAEDTIGTVNRYLVLLKH